MCEAIGFRGVVYIDKFVVWLKIYTFIRLFLWQVLAGYLYFNQVIFW